MSKEKETKVLQRIEDAINNLETKENTLFFFVSDSKNIPNSNTLYVYQMAKTLQELGYKVCMLYQLNNEYSKSELDRLKRLNKPIDPSKIFEGVGEWLGEKYSSLEHMNIADSKWMVSPSDFLFIPEVFSSLMRETFNKSIPCKRYVILQNFRYICDFIPFGDQWINYGITNAIVSTDKQGALIESVFPYVKTRTLNPFIQENMCKPVKAKKLIVNIAAPKSSYMEHIIKTFYWKYPAMQFLTFRTLKNLPTEKYAEYLKEGCITVWYDPETQFGYSALDAMACGNIVIGKLPETVPEWMMKEGNEIADNGIWYNDINDIPDILAKVIGSWMRDELPQEIYDDMDKTVKKYSYERWEHTLKDIIEEIFTKRKEEFESIKKNVENKIKNEEE